MPDANWYEAMGKAMAKREKCINAINRWKQDLAEVEAEIEALRVGEQAAQQAPAAAELAEDVNLNVAAEPALTPAAQQFAYGQQQS